MPTVATGDLIAAADWNQVGDNFDHLAALKAGGTALSSKSSAAELLATPKADYTLNESSNYTTTSTSFADIDAVKLALSITSNGGDVLVQFHGTFTINAASTFWLELMVDGVAHAGDDGIGGFSVPATGAGVTASFTRLIKGLSAGSHTFKLRWKTLSNTLTLYAGAGTASWDVHPQFWVKEIFNS
jgi:hypothetical protein